MEKTFDNQVLSIEQCNHLRKLGWTDFPHYTDKTGIGLIFPTEYTCKRFKPISALHYLTLTTADIMEVLPSEIINDSHEVLTLKIYKNGNDRFYVCYSTNDDVEQEEHEADSTLIEALYDTLVWCIENGYVEVKGSDE